MSEDPENELASVVASTQELLRWEEALGGAGFPRTDGRSFGRASSEALDSGEIDMDLHARLEVLAAEAAQCTL
ncbi:MAG: hypothetical protein PVI24_00955, partial [Myxococcales bacterium]